MQDFTIRAATITDLPHLSRLWMDKMSVQQQIDRRLRLAVNARQCWERAATGWLGDPGYLMVVGAADDALQGYLVACIQSSPPGLLPERIGCITEIALDQHRYSGGLATAMLMSAREWFAEQGVEQAVARILSTQAIEQAFWRAQGAQAWVEWLWLKSSFVR